MKPRPASAPYQYRSFRMAAAVDALDSLLGRLRVAPELAAPSLSVRVGTLRGYPVFLSVEMREPGPSDTQTIPYEAVS